MRQDASRIDSLVWSRAHPENAYMRGSGQFRQEYLVDWRHEYRFGLIATLSVVGSVNTEVFCSTFSRDYSSIVGGSDHCDG